ncbi:nickel pincer cofactor biosynthesis protein LarB [Secundilactobacillus hailunensis]|uniref:Nickel pincer cofactor biosynthesis protein LarB n=1 Tax=Secundilactobacillus hailunensis TaxID=2559923 RepID=A0ABW1T8F1_9LACO|nr:nickel pincer cofactor biosynthesis protein LarB [Secundilactobacillus hailunensis]
MGQDKMIDILKAVQRHDIDVDTARQKLVTNKEALPFADLDLERQQRTGYPETVFGEGKTAEQITAIIEKFRENEQVVLCTRISPEKAHYVSQKIAQAKYYQTARCLVIGDKMTASPDSYIAIVSAGTSDIPITEEAAVTAETFGNRVERVYDVGVAGIHRLFEHLDVIRGAKVVIVAAGMDGALASVVGGLVASPVIALPTSIGYGSSFNGLSALLTMLNSCAEGVTVVNIDNGFGAAYSASVINHM